MTEPSGAGRSVIGHSCLGIDWSLGLGHWGFNGSVPRDEKRVYKVILWRILQFPLILAVIYVLTFLLAWVAPGSPFGGDRKLDPLVEADLKRRFHAESPIQFLTWYPLNIVLRGDFGPSMQYKEWSVNSILAATLPVSITLGMFALTLAVLVGVGVGTLAAVKRGGGLDWFSLSIALIGISLPSFVTAAILLM